MKARIISFWTAACILLINSPQVFGKNNTSDFWLCSDRQGGSWTIGRAANICNVNPFQNPTEVNSYWSQVMYDDAKYSSSTTVKNNENNRYGSEMNALLSGFAEKYYLKRNPAATTKELSAWIKAILAVSHHESIWTHYRLGSDKKVRMLRGDFGHGHGLMQVDDRWHYAYVKEGGAARIQDNLIFGLDLFYDLWTKAGSASCVGGSTNYLSRTRATYSMYNGGVGSVCRWKNTSHKWYKNDKNFYDRFVQEGWKKNIISMNTFKYNFSCLIQDGGLKCFDEEDNSSSSPDSPVVETPDSSDPSFSLSVDELYYVKSKNLNCTWNNSFLSCFDADLQIGKECLVNLFGIEKDKEFIDVEAQTNLNITTKMIDPDKKCISQSEVAVGDLIQTKVAINIRKTPGGNKITTASAKSIFQVLDIYINTKSKIIYYLVSSKAGTGYMYSGTASSSYKYVTKTFSNNTKLIASENDIIEIKNSVGINMRATPGGSYILTIPSFERLKVLSRLIRGENKYVYYKVEYKNAIGYVYAGSLAPSPNVSHWAEVR